MALQIVQPSGAWQHSNLPHRNERVVSSDRQRDKKNITHNGHGNNHTPQAKPLNPFSTPLTKAKNGQPQVPVFIAKLLGMINDATNRDLIYWSPNGDTFMVSDMDKLAQRELPKYFKHSNFTSLVRQLNMYGFHKVASSSPSLKGDLSIEEQGSCEFHHPLVHRDHPDLLVRIKRKENSKHKKPLAKEDAQRLRNEIAALREENLKLKQQFQQVKTENESLWEEVADHRKRHEQQQWTIDNIIKYLSVLYKNGSIDFPSDVIAKLPPPKTKPRGPKRRRTDTGLSRSVQSAPPVVAPTTRMELQNVHNIQSEQENIHACLRKRHDTVHQVLYQHREKLQEHMEDHWIESIFNPPESLPKNEQKDMDSDDFIQHLDVNFNLMPLDSFFDNTSDKPNAMTDHTVPDSGVS